MTPVANIELTYKYIPKYFFSQMLHVAVENEGSFIVYTLICAEMNYSHCCIKNMESDPQMGKTTRPLPHQIVLKPCQC